MARYKSAGTICWSELRGRHSGDTEITQTPLDIGCSMGTPHWAAFLDDRCAQVGHVDAALCPILCSDSRDDLGCRTDSLLLAKASQRERQELDCCGAYEFEDTYWRRLGYGEFSCFPMAGARPR
jgi:hypothetical protein